MAKDDGGNAFPQALDRQHGFVGADGLSLRDYFAGQVCRGGADAICDSMDPESPKSDDEIQQHAARHAKAAYLLADALLKERAKA